MIKFSALYPNTEGVTFNFDYYSNSHVPMTKHMLGDSLKDIGIEKGLAGAAGNKAPYIAIGHLYFDSFEGFRSKFLPHIEAFRQDIPNFTNVQPVIQISEVLI